MVKKKKHQRTSEYLMRPAQRVSAAAAHTPSAPTCHGQADPGWVDVSIARIGIRRDHPTAWQRVGYVSAHPSRRVAMDPLMGLEISAQLPSLSCRSLDVVGKY